MAALLCRGEASLTLKCRQQQQKQIHAYSKHFFLFLFTPASMLRSLMLWVRDKSMLTLHPPPHPSPTPIPLAPLQTCSTHADNYVLLLLEGEKFFPAVFFLLASVHKAQWQTQGVQQVR